MSLSHSNFLFTSNIQQLFTLSTSTSNLWFIFNINFCLCPTTNFCSQHCYLTMFLATYLSFICVPFTTNLNYSTFATTYLRNFATNFTFFCNFLSTSNQFNSFFSNQPVNQTILFQLSNFIFLFSMYPPWIFFWSDLPFLCQVFRGSHVEDRLTLVLDNSITCELYVMRNSMYT